MVFALALTMLMGMSTVAFAAERESEVPELTKVDAEGQGGYQKYRDCQRG